jgi:hypothetical protein
MDKHVAVLKAGTARHRDAPDVVRLFMRSRLAGRRQAADDGTH